MKYQDITQQSAKPAPELVWEISFDQQKTQVVATSKQQAVRKVAALVGADPRDVMTDSEYITPLRVANPTGAVGEKKLLVWNISFDQRPVTVVAATKSAAIDKAAIIFDASAREVRVNADFITPLRQATASDIRNDAASRW